MPTGNDLSQTKLCAKMPAENGELGERHPTRGHPGLKEVADCAIDRAEGGGESAEAAKGPPVAVTAGQFGFGDHEAVGQPVPVI